MGWTRGGKGGPLWSVGVWGARVAPPNSNACSAHVLLSLPLPMCIVTTRVAHDCSHRRGGWEGWLAQIGVARPAAACPAACMRPPPARCAPGRAPCRSCKVSQHLLVLCLCCTVLQGVHPGAGRGDCGYSAAIDSQQGGTCSIRINAAQIARGVQKPEQGAAGVGVPCKGAGGRPRVLHPGRPAASGGRFGRPGAALCAPPRQPCASPRLMRTSHLSMHARDRARPHPPPPPTPPPPSPPSNRLGYMPPPPGAFPAGGAAPAAAADAPHPRLGHAGAAAGGEGAAAEAAAEDASRPCPGMCVRRVSACTRLRASVWHDTTRRNVWPLKRPLVPTPSTQCARAR